MSERLHNVYYLTALSLTRREGHPGWREVARVADVPFVAGCYAIYHDGQLVYVGSSSRLKQRISVYLNQRGRGAKSGGSTPPSPDVRVVVKVTGSRRLGDWLMREYRLIQRLRPRDNFNYAQYRPFAKKPVPMFVCLGCEMAFGYYEHGKLIPHGGGEARCLP